MLIRHHAVFSTDVAFSTIKTKIQLFHNVGHYCKRIDDYHVLNILVQAPEYPEAIRPRPIMPA